MCCRTDNNCAKTFRSCCLCVSFFYVRNFSHCYFLFIWKWSRRTHNGCASYKLSSMFFYGTWCTLITYYEISVPSYAIFSKKNPHIFDQQIAAWECILVTCAQLCLFKAENCDLHARPIQLIIVSCHVFTNASFSGQAALFGMDVEFVG